MPDPIKRPNVSFDFSFQKNAGGEPLDEDAPLRIAILAGFGGGAKGERVLQVDCDNFDSVCARFGASLNVPGAGVLSFTNLDDFHPDQLLKRVPALARLVELRSQLRAPGGSESAAAEVQALLGGETVAPAAVTGETPASAESPDDMIARLLGRAPTGHIVQKAPDSIVGDLIKQAVESSVIRSPSASQQQLLPMLEEWIAKELRSILHHPDFQSIEAAWRGLDFLVREAGESVKLHAIDISSGELDAQLSSMENPAATGIGRHLEKLAPTVILGAFSFGQSDSDALLRIARLAASCGTAFIGAAKSELTGCASFASQPNPLDWAQPAAMTLRKDALATRIGLALPRFLIRQPYGNASDPIQTLPFEELPTADAHECYLWANPAFLCGHRLVTAFSEDGWDMELGGAGGEIGGLPVYSFKAGGEKETKPCAEALLSDKAADAILSRGLMPVLSVKGRDSVLLVSLRSISDPPRPLAFRLG